MGAERRPQPAGRRRAGRVGPCMRAARANVSSPSKLFGQRRGTLLLPYGKNINRILVNTFFSYSAAHTP